MGYLLDLLALWVEFVIVCDDSFHTEVGEPGPQFVRLSVQLSAAGYYLGYFCPVCGPYDRCSSYMSKDRADKALEFEFMNCIAAYAM